MDLWIKNDVVSLKAHANKLPHKGKQSSFPLRHIQQPLNHKEPNKGGCPILSTHVWLMLCFKRAHRKGRLSFTHKTAQSRGTDNTRLIFCTFKQNAVSFLDGPSPIFAGVFSHMRDWKGEARPVGMHPSLG